MFFLHPFVKANCICIFVTKEPQQYVHYLKAKKLTFCGEVTYSIGQTGLKKSLNLIILTDEPREIVVGRKG
jgi:hypothetical protein